MMKQRWQNLISLSLLVLVSSCVQTTSQDSVTSQNGSITGSSSSTSVDNLPNFPATPDDGKDSWEHDNSEFTIDWYVNNSWFLWTSNGTDLVSRILKEKTGVSIRFITPLTDSGELLATMIASNNLPDVVSIQSWYPQVSQLAEQGYVYPFDDLINKWAPSFKKRIQDDVWNWFAQSDGKTYGVPNFAYSNEYVDATTKMEPNGAILVREDWYYEVENQGIDMTTPAGFIQGAKYIKQKYGANAIPIQLDNFDLEGNPSVNWLAQYFAVPYESKTDGKYQYMINSPRYQEMLEFLNEAYREGLIADSNFSANSDQIKTNLATGKVFVSMVTPQDFTQSFISTFTKGIRYIPLVLRNKDHQAPILQDIRGMGYLLSMITKNAERPDKIIKVMDYLYSEEGQRLVAFGEEGVTWNWTDETKTAVQWTDKYLADFAAEDTGQYGLYQMTLLMNLAYINPLKPQTGKRDVDIYFENLKRPLSPYSYNFTASFLKPDASDPNYFTISNKANKIRQSWAEWLPSIIRSTTREKAITTYNSAMSDLTRRGLAEVIAFNSTSYQRAKDSLGLTWGYPANQSGYTEPVTGPNGDFSYWKGATYEKPTN